MKKRLPPFQKIIEIVFGIIAIIFIIGIIFIGVAASQFAGSDYAKGLCKVYNPTTYATDCK